MARRPEYTLVAKQKTDDPNKKAQQNPVGAAWDNNGVLSIRLNVGVRLNWDDELWLTLFPATYDDDGSYPKSKATKTSSAAPVPAAGAKTDEGDIPF